MAAPARITAFLAALAAVFAGAAVAGGAIDPDRAGDQDRSAGDHAMNDKPHAAASHGGAEPAQDAQPVRGLAVAERGLQLVLDDPELRRGESEQLAFRIVDEGGETLRRFDVEHERRMHLIVVRRDLTGFQHLHPKMNDDGIWKAALRLTEAGSYRVYADFSYEGEARTLASDVRVPTTSTP